MAKPSVVSALGNSSSISSLTGDATSAPIREETAQPIPGDQVVPPMYHEAIDESLLWSRKYRENKQTRLEKRVAEDSDVSQEKKREEDLETSKPVLVAVDTNQRKRKTYWKPKDPKPIVIEKPTGQSITIFDNRLNPDPDLIYQFNPKEFAQILKRNLSEATKKHISQDDVDRRLNRTTLEQEDG